jgi:anti-sigma B factor antagonist
MNIEIKEKENCLIIYLKKYFKLIEAEHLRNNILNEIIEKNNNNIIFNLKDLDYLDSSGLGLFINIKYNLKSNLQFRICNIKNNLKELFEFAKLNDFFIIDKTEEDSIEYFKKKNNNE